jgi:protein phosphatase
MQPAPDTTYDVASAISQGRRPYQEDALVTDFSLGSGLGFAVLADGMGGHAAGDVASKIVVTEVFSELKLQNGDRSAFAENLPRILRDAAMAANDCVKGHILNHAETTGMGATLLAPVLVGSKLFWISVGDSPLFLFRNGALRQLNEDHSMAPQIDFMVRTGMMTEDVGRNHPDRSCLTSVLGGEHVARIDCPTEPTDLEDGDILIVASDGIQYLSVEEIEAILSATAEQPSRTIADTLLARLEAHGDPEQDNASFSVIKVSAPVQPSQRPSRPRRSAKREEPAEAEVIARAPSRFKSSIIMRGASLFRSSAQ